jgi:hormone-sensitive lipase
MKYFKNFKSKLPQKFLNKIVEIKNLINYKMESIHNDLRDLKLQQNKVYKTELNENKFYNSKEIENLEISKVSKYKEYSDIKYPTFEDVNLEEDLKNEITYENLLVDINCCEEALSHLCQNYDSLFFTYPKRETIKEKLKEHNMNHIVCKMLTSILKRQLTLINHLLRKKYSNNNEERELAQKFIIQNYLELSNEEILNQLIEENINYFNNGIDSLNQNDKINQEKHVNSEILKDIEEKEINQDYKKIILENLNLLIKNEKSLVDFENNTENFLPSICSLNLSLKILKSVIDETSNQIKDMLEIKIKTIENLSEEVLIKFFHNCNKIDILANFFMLCYKIPHDDIYNLPENSETWLELKKHFERRVIFSRHTLKKKLQKVFDMIILGNASVSKGHGEFNSKYSKILGTGWYFAYFFFNKKKANIQSIKFSINPNYDIAKVLWNMLDAKGIRNILKLTMPRINYSKKCFLLRTEPEITLDYINDLLVKIKSKDFIVKIEKDLNDKRKFSDKLILQGHYQSEYDSKILDNKSEINLNNKQINNSPLYLTKPDEKIINNYVKVKIISHRDYFTPNKNTFWNNFKCCSGERTQNPRAAVIHIHGGGFIAMSASSHENYTRKWANMLEIPLFSIDYRLAPENPYPKALDDVYQAYMWIIKYAEDFYKMDLDKIILVGDSAGGNLVVSLCYLLILSGRKLPTAIFLAYPGKLVIYNKILKN